MKASRQQLMYLLTALTLLAAACGGADTGTASEDADAGAATAAATEPAAATEAGADETEAEETEAAATEAGAAETEAEAAADLGAVTVVASIGTTFEFLPAELGAELGVWEERGLTVENLYVEGSGQAGQTMAAGEADIALEGGASGIAAILAGLETRFIGEIGRDFNMMVVVAPTDGEVSAVEDLRGRTIGITSAGSLTDYVASSVVRSQGWEESELEKATVGGLTEQLAALDAGAIDAFVWSAEAGFQLEEEGTGQVILSADEIIENNVYEAITSRTAFIEENPDAVEAYLQGWYETVQYMKDNRDETIAFCVEQFELTEFVCESTYDLDIDNMSTDGTLPDENLQGLADSVVERGLADEAPAVDAFYDGRFLPVSLDG